MFFFQSKDDIHLESDERDISDHHNIIFIEDFQHFQNSYH